MTITIEHTVKIMLTTENDMAKDTRINTEVSIPIANTELLVITETTITKDTTVHLAHPNHILMIEKHTQAGITQIKGTRTTRKSMQSQINIIVTEDHTVATVTKGMHRSTTAKNTVDMVVVMVPMHHRDTGIGITMGQPNRLITGTVQRGTVEIITEVTATAGMGTMTNKAL